LSEKQNSSSVGAHSHKLDFTEWIISDFSYSSIISSNIFGRKWSLRSRVYVLCEIKPILLVIVQLLPFAGKTLQIKSWGNVQSIRALLLSSSNFKFLCEFFLREFGRERNQRRDWSSSISLRFCCCWNLNEYFSIFCCWWRFEQQQKRKLILLLQSRLWFLSLPNSLKKNSQRNLKFDDDKSRARIDWTLPHDLICNVLPAKGNNCTITRRMGFISHRTYTLERKDHFLPKMFDEIIDE
jgi:hypothetical protein